MKRVMRGRGGKFLAGLLVLAMLVQTVSAVGRPKQASAAAAGDAVAAVANPATASTPTDVVGHWAEKAIRVWLDEGWVSGFPDGRFRPDGQVKRAELAAFVNRAFHYTKAAEGSFSDVPSGKWYAKDAAIAQEAGYMQGDGKGSFRPEANVTREEAAVIVARLLKLDASDAAEADKFADAKSMSAWSRGAIAAVAKAGVMKGYDGNLFQAAKPLTRAEAVALLERVRNPSGEGASANPTALSVRKAGTYGPESGTRTYEGDVEILVPNVVLRNATIQGNLLLGEGIGEGDVTLDGVIVEGTTTIKGGGKNSVHILNSTLTRVFVTKVDGQVRVVIEGSTAVDQVTVESGAVLQVASGSGASYGTVRVSTTGEVTLDGDFPNVVLAAAAQVTVTSGKVDTLTLTEQAAGAEVTLLKQSQVGTVNADAASTFKGDGTIGTASVTKPGVSIAQKPGQTIVADGVTAQVGGSTVSGSNAGSSGSGGGPVVAMVAVTASNLSAAGFDLKMTPAVPDLTIANVVMVNADGMPALVSKIRTADGGSNYRADGFLTGGAVYSLSLAKPGYAFGGAKSLAIPDVPAVTGAMVSPDLTKLVLLFSKPMAALPASSAGFSLTDAGAPVAITAMVLSASGTRIEFTLGAAVHPSTLALGYTPGTVRSTDNKALPALSHRDFTDGGTPAGRAAYDRMQGMTAAQAATDLKDGAGASADAAASALIEGGYNTNDLIKALNTVYGITNESMPTLLMPKGISVYHLLIGMQAAGILNVQNLGKNFSYLNGQSDDWVRALKQAEYTDAQVVSYSWFFPNAKLAESMRKYYGMTAERAAKLLIAYDSFSEDVGRVLKEVYGSDDLQATTAVKAAGIDASKAGMMLKEVYGADENRTADLLRTAGYSAEVVGAMLIRDYGAAPDNAAKAMRYAGYAIAEIYPSLGYAPNPAAAIRGAYTVEEAFQYLMSQSGRIDNAVFFLKTGGYSSVEAATVLLTKASIRTRTELMDALTSRGPEAAPGMPAYNVDEALEAVRKKLGGSLTELAAVLAPYNVPTVATMRPGESTQVAALVRAGFTYNDILLWLAPSNTLSQAQASNVLFELRNAGYPLNGLQTVVASLSKKAFGSMNTQSQIRLLAASGMNTTTNQPIPGYSAAEIAKYLTLTGQTNNYGLGQELPLVFTKLETVQAMVDASGTTLIDMLRVLSDTRLFQGATDYAFMGQVLKDIYRVNPVEAAIALKGSNIPSMNEIYPIKTILSQTYGDTDTTSLIHDLAEAGFSTYDIGVGLNLNGQSFKDAGYPATDVAQFIRVRLNTQMDVMVLALKNLGYGLDEITLALRNMYGNSGAGVVTQVTELLNAQGNGFTPEQVTASVNAVFGVDSFVMLAQSMKGRGISAVQAASTLKGLFADTGAVDMANGLKNAGYAREDVLVGIFRTYCDGYIYATNALPTMDAVLAQAYPEVTNRLAATLQASDVKTANYAVSVLQWLERPFGDAVAILNGIYGLDEMGTLDAMLQNRSYTGTVEIMNAVGDYYHMDGFALYLKWLYRHNYTADYVLVYLQQTNGYDDSVTIARMMQEAGYSKVAILNAIDDKFGGDIPNGIALVMVRLFGTDDLDTVAKELHDRGFNPRLVFPALLEAFPNKTQGELLVAMKTSGYADLYETLVGVYRGDATAIAQLRNVGLRVSQAVQLLQRWNYSLRDQIRYAIDIGYSLPEVGRALGTDVKAVIGEMLALRYSFERIVAVAYAMDDRPGMLIYYLYQKGYTNIDDLVKALVLVHEDPRKYVLDLKEMQSEPNASGPARTWTATTVALSIARNSQLTLAELGQSFLESNRYSKLDIYYALKAIADIGVSFIQEDLDGAISTMLTDLSDGIPFAILREAGMSSNDAASVMKQLGWDWIPACIQLVQAGYSAGDTWGTLWDVYHNELGFQVLNIMTSVAPLASLGLADNLTTFQSVLRGAMRKAMMSYFLSR